MKNEEIIAELTRTLHVAWYYNNRDGDERTEHAVREIIRKLAECGMSEEMKQAVRDHSSVSTNRAAVAFRAALRSLGGE